MTNVDVEDAPHAPPDGCDGCDNDDLDGGAVMSIHVRLP
jgi:hypothetical protein